MMNKLKWRFPPGHGMIHGFNSAGIVTYAGDRIGSLTREIVQNSLDAKNPEIENSPVTIEFSLFNLKQEDIPDINNLKRAINNSYSEVTKLGDPTPRKFFKNAQKLINSNSIPFLRISDFKTTGLTGVNSNNPSPWMNLVRSQGVSDKGRTAGGSFGIGKNATFACSDLRTVIYSTLTSSGEIGTQGVANLISFDDELGYKTLGVGFLSINDNHDALPELITLDLKFQRKEPGTDIYIAGLNQRENLVEEIITEVLDNFFYAIYKNELEIIIGNININSQNLQDIVLDYREIIKETTFELYRLFFEDDVHIYKEKVIDDENDLEIRIILSDESSRKISMIRKPWMKIKDLSRFPIKYKFMGVAIINGDNLNTILRKTENPQHNDWELDRLDYNSEEQKEADAILKEIERLIREKLEKLHEIDLSDYLDIFGAEEYIPLIDPESDNKAQQKVEDIVKSTRAVKVSPLKIGNPSMEVIQGEYEIEFGESEDEFVLDDPNPYKEESKKKRDNFEMNLKKGTLKVTKKKEDIKIIAKDRHNGWYRIMINSDKNAKYHLKFDILDEQAAIIKDSLVIENAKVNGINVSILENYLQNIDFNRGSNIIDVKINHHIYVSIGVEIYEIQR